MHKEAKEVQHDKHQEIKSMIKNEAIKVHSETTIL